MTQKTLVSLFAGIGGFDLGFERAGFKPIGMCEIDPHARSVLDRHWPDVPKHDDVTTLTGSTFGPADVVTFGSPCQDLSVAGKRAGLAGERSGLFLEAMRYIREMLEETNGQYPRAAVWENVPGAFSSNGGADFAAVLQSMVGGTVRRPTHGWANSGVAFGPEGAAEWRVLDSQHFGVAQRRRRVFVIYHPGGERAGQVLLERESLRRDSETSRPEGQGATGAAEGGAGDSGAIGLSGEFNAAYELQPTLQHGSPSGGGTNPMVATRQQWPAEIASTLDASFGDKQGLDNQHINSGAALFVPAPAPVAFKVRGGKEGGDKGYLGSEDKALTLSTVQEQFLAEPIGFDHAAGVAHGMSEREGTAPTLQSSSGIGRAAVAFAMRGRDGGAVPEVSGDQASALRGADGGSSRDYVAMIQGSAIVRSDSAGPAGSGFTEGAAFTLDTKQPHAVVFPIQDGREVEKNQNGLGVGGERDPSYTLDTTGGQAVAFAENSRNEVGLEGGDGQVVGALSTGGGKPGQGTPTIATTYAVRRLTPVECERLQAFPDDHTRYAADGTEIADTHRYRMLGNAVTVNVAHAIGNALRYAT